MPNWVENDLTVTGKRNDIKKFQAAVKGDEPDAEGYNRLIDANKIIPYPKEYADADKAAHDWDNEEAAKTKANPSYHSDWHNRPADGYNNGGYDWCMKNWGTNQNLAHFNVDDIRQNSNGDWEKLYHFDTANSEPTPIIRTLGEIYPELTFELRYFDSSNEWNGIFVMENGKISRDESGYYYGDRGG